jgi:hypothetical protein
VIHELAEEGRPSRMRWVVWVVGRQREIGDQVRSFERVPGVEDPARRADVDQRRLEPAPACGGERRHPLEDPSEVLRGTGLQGGRGSGRRGGDPSAEPT